MTLSFLKFRVITLACIAVVILQSCLPKENIVFKSVRNASVEADNGNPVLRGEALFYNPNKVKMKLKAVDMEIFIEGKKTATVKHSLNVIVPPQSDFTVPIQANLSLKEIGLMDAVLSLFGGKKYTVEFSGYIWVAMHGFPAKIKVKHKEEVKLKF